MDTHKDDTKLESGFSIPVSWLALGAAAILVLGATFWAGMTFEKHRRDGEAVTVVGGREPDGDGGTPEPAPVELEVDETVEVTGPNGDLAVTLDAVGYDYESLDSGVKRVIELTFTLGNFTGKTTRLTMNGLFEDRLGQTIEHVESTCLEEDPLPGEPQVQGRFVKGCLAMTIPNDAGRVVFPDFSPELYVEVPAE